MRHGVRQPQPACDKSAGPSPLLLEQRVELASGYSVRRVLGNGEVWVCPALDPRSGNGARFADRDDAGWRHETTLPRDELAALQDAIAASGFFDCAPEYRRERAVFHATDEIWTANLGARQHTVAVRGRPITDVPAVSSVATALEDALADAAYG